MASRRPVAVVLEDDGGVRQLLDAILYTEGWGRVLGGSWEEVREATEWADVLLADHQLPGRSGLDIIEEVRSRRPEMKVIMLTGDRSARERAADLGVTGFLVKPFDVTELIALLRDSSAEAIDLRPDLPGDVDLRTVETPWSSPA